MIGLLALAALPLCQGGTHEGEVRVWCAGSTEKIEDDARSTLPHKGVWDKESNKVRLIGVRGEHVPFQIIVTADQVEVEGITVTPTDLRSAGSVLPAAQTKVFLEHMVKVYAPTGEHGRAGYWPDALVPLKRPFAIRSARRDRGPILRHQPLWVDVVLPRDQEPGTYKGEVVVAAGDEVLQVQFKYVPETKTGDGSQAGSENFQGQLGYAAPLDLEATPISWLDVHHSLQTALPATELTVSYRRAKNLETATVIATESDKWFFPIRGLVFVATERTCQSESMVAAFGLGFRETKEKLAGVGKVLKMLFTREIPVKSLGGPVIIAKIAGGEAAQGLPRLLIFLTFLSANLAVLNFLPIPALDGGHMVFLLVEGVTGKPVNEQVQGVLTLVGVACLLSLMIFVLGNDIFRVFF